MSQAVDASRISELADTVAMALQEARAAGATQAEADVSLQQGLNVTVRLGEVETIEYQRDRGLGITVYFDHAKGSASSADLRPEAVREMVAKACAIARHTARDEFAGLADAGDMARDVPDLDLYHPWDLTPEEAIERARATEAAGLAVDKRLANSEGASVSTHRGVRVYGNSHGFLGGYPVTSHSVSCVLLAQEGNDMQRDYWYSAARDARALEPGDAIGRRAGQRALARLGARQITTRKAPILFSADMARGFFGHMVAAVRGSSQYRKSSFLLDAMGQQVLPAFMQMRERPHLPGAMASSPFDGEGVATRDRDLVRDGVLQGYVLGSYSARKLGLKSTGNAGGIHNLLLDSSEGLLDTPALLQRMGSGFYVTELMGQGVNGVTGDYSRGASGFWVENGELAYPVHEVTIAGNLKDMYRGVQALGSEVDRLGAIQTGPVLLDEMTIAGG
ncbi:MAG TPA: metalloprotease PmbA [Steroidobacteraceae bacterium]|nr:metalloprotease PmbA [Steroidobacteraceae bacterium]